MKRSRGRFPADDSDWLLTGDPGSVALLGAKVDFSLYLKSSETGQFTLLVG